MAYKRNRYGSIILQDEQGKNFTITKKEKAEFDKLVKRANQRRTDRSKALYKGIKDQKNMVGISYDSYFDLLEKKGFITEKYNGSVKDISSKAEFKNILSELKQVTKHGYGNKRLEDIRKWAKKKVKEEHNNNKQLKDMFTNMSDSQLLSIYLHNDNILKELWGSGDETQDFGEVEEVSPLTTKTISDINIQLSNTQNVKGGNKDIFKGKKKNKRKR